MKRLRFLLLDANVVIKLFSLGLWDAVVEKCEVLISGIVAGEAKRYSNEAGEHRIDLSDYVNANKIELVDIPASTMKVLRDKFAPTYLERMDDGETESLAYLIDSSDRCLICSADSIVFKVLGRLALSEQGISLEEAFQMIGLGRPLEWRFSKAFRERYTVEGEQNAIQDFGMK